MRFGILAELAGRRVDVGCGEHPDRAGVHDRRHRVPVIDPAADGLEHVDGADDVDPRPERRIGLAERHLERREMDDVGDVVIVHRPLEGSELGDVAGHQRDTGEVVRDEYLAEPASVLPDIESDDREPLADDLAHRPRADATEGTRDEEPFPAHATDRTLANRQTLSSRPIRSISTVIRSPSPR